MEYSTLKAAVEALLYVADEPVSLKRIRDSLQEDMELEGVREALSALVAEFEADGRGVRIAELAGGYQIVTRPEFSAYVKKLQKIKPPRLTHQALETLAIIAYRQPIIRAEIEAIRGVSSGGVLKTLLDRRLVKVAGRQDVPGKPLMYSTSREFLQYFGLKDLSELPSLRELERELGVEGGTLLNNLEPELPGLDGPEMEAMAEEYRSRKAAVVGEEEAGPEADEDIEIDPAEFMDEDAPETAADTEDSGPAGGLQEAEVAETEDGSPDGGPGLDAEDDDARPGD